MHSFKDPRAFGAKDFISRLHTEVMHGFEAPELLAVRPPPKRRPARRFRRSVSKRLALRGMNHRAVQDSGPHLGRRVFAYREGPSIDGSNPWRSCSPMADAQAAGVAYSSSDERPLDQVVEKRYRVAASLAMDGHAGSVLVNRCGVRPVHVMTRASRKNEERCD